MNSSAGGVPPCVLRTPIQSPTDLITQVTNPALLKNFSFSKAGFLWLYHNGERRFEEFFEAL